MELLNDTFYWIKDKHEVEHALSLREKLHFIDGIHFEQHFFLEGLNEIKCIHFSECVFSANFYLSQEIDHLTFCNCTFIGNVIFRHEARPDNLTFRGCLFRKHIIFNKVIIGHLILVQCKQDIITYDSLIIFEDFFCGQLKFEQNNFLTSISFDLDWINNKINIIPGNTNYTLTFYRTSSNLESSRWSKELILDYLPDSKTSILIKNAVLDRLYINGINGGAQLVINNLKVMDITLENFSNYGVVKISNLKTFYNYFGNISITNSNLGKLEIVGCDFSHFRKIRLSNSSFIDIIPMGIIWCERIKDVAHISKEDYKKYSEIYRQLKIVMAKNCDKISELFFERQEMFMYRKYLNTEKHLFRFSERFILWSNQWSNNFGQSWIQALSWLIFLNLLMYNLVFALLHFENSISYSFITHLSNYFEFINPVHGFKTLFELDKIENVSPKAKLLDNISRILNSYLLFQFIRAFRKLVR